MTYQIPPDWISANNKSIETVEKPHNQQTTPTQQTTSTSPRKPTWRLIQNTVNRELGKLLKTIRKDFAEKSRARVTQSVGISNKRLTELENGVAEMTVSELIMFMDECKQRPDVLLQPLFGFYRYLITAPLSNLDIKTAKLGDETSYLLQQYKDAETLKQAIAIDMLTEKMQTTNE